MTQFAKRISSRQNPVVVRYRSAARGDGDLLLLDGFHLIAEALDAHLRFQHLLVSPEALDRPDIVELAQRVEAAGAEVAEATAPVMAAVSPVRTPSGIVALVSRPSEAADRMYGSHPLVIIGCDIQDPGNLGAIVRVAEAGGASGVIAAGACANPFSWKALRGSMGSALRLPIAVTADVELAVADARRHRCRIVAAMPRHGASPFDTDLTPPLAILVGGEGPGLPAAVLQSVDHRVSIPMQAPVESLNAAVTAALIVYEARRQRVETNG